LKSLFKDPLQGVGVTLLTVAASLMISFSWQPAYAQSAKKPTTTQTLPPKKVAPTATTAPAPTPQTQVAPAATTPANPAATTPVAVPAASAAAPAKSLPAKPASSATTARGARTAAPTANASVTGLTIRQINIQGEKKIEKDAIETRLKSKIGGAYSEEQIREDIQNLFKTGYFYDIQVNRETAGSQVDLTYTVVEKPSIAEIVFEGNSELKTEELLETSGLKAFEIISMPKLREATDKIQKMYEDKGFFLAKIDTKIEDVKKDESVKITFNIKENEKVKVKKITFLGNRKLKDGYLKGRMATNEGGFFSALSGSGAYKQDAFDVDVQKLRYMYFNEGYVQVKVDRPQVYVTPDKKNIYITIRIDEGEQFDVGDIDFAGDLLYTRDELSAAIEINKRQVFSYDVLQKDLSELQAKYGDLGYAFANVIPRTRINEKERKVDVTFEFDKGNKVYFGQINVVGNSKTRDKVVRRELKVREGELYNETRRRQSLENIQRLGFFDEVNFKTSTPPEKPDQLNIDVVVKERNTGSIQLGAGYGSATGFQLQGQINQSNFLGKGQKLSAGLNLSTDYQSYNFNFTEPYFRDTEWSLGVDVYQTMTTLTDYKDKRTGGAFRFGHPLGEDLTGTVRLKYEDAILDPVTQTINNNTKDITDRALFDLEKFSGDTRSVTGYLEYDIRNDRFSPSKGVYTSTSLEYAGFDGKIQFTKGNATARYFKKLFWDVVWRNNLSYSFITAPEGRDVPFMERFKLGGPYSLRGYNFYRIGTRKLSQTLYCDKDFRQTYGGAASGCDAGGTPLDMTNDDTIKRAATRTIGGTQMGLYQAELEFPLIAEAGIKGVVFFDVGEAEDQLSAGDVYSDVGFGFRWFSPIGPLRFEWGFPNRMSDASPDSVVFDFSIGAPF
jgi:outer membrane protein insertion porin family